MVDLFDAAISPANLPYTLLLGIAAAFWIAVLLGLCDVRLLDWNQDEDDSGSASGGFVTAITDFLHLDAVPVSVFVTVVLIVAWMFSMLINHWSPNHSHRTTLLLAVPNFVASVLVARLVIGVAGRLRGQRREIPLVGRLCEVISSQVDEHDGECVLAGIDSRLVLASRTRDGEVLQHGEIAVIVEWLRAERLFIVTRHRAAN